jgi:superfamily II DNA or RNA helicase
MTLRRWQKQSATQAFEKYCSGQQHFLCLATPGAGKTRMAAEVAKRLFQQGRIDFVICFSPSVATANGMQETLECVLNAPLTGRIGAKGVCVTYQSLNHKDTDFWNIFRQHRVFAIFDEIHHCGGNDVNDANVWAQHILVNVQSHAHYTLALSGTPWRSDNRPVTLSKYSDFDGSIHCDFEYGLADAIRENVCRIPYVTVIENDNISLVSKTGETKVYKSIQQMLLDESISYQSVVEADSVISFCLKQAQKQLKVIKQNNPNAAVLVVASSIEHAERIAEKLRSEYTDSVVVVTSRSIDSETIIKQFQYTNTEWLVSVGMVSEGTDIPRLQVCCHLTRIKTELHFRQILGRIMRLTNIDETKQAHLFAPAQPQIVEYAKRLYDDIPHEVASLAVVTDQQFLKIGESCNDSELPMINSANTAVNKTAPLENELHTNTFPMSLLDTYFCGLGFKGRFTKELIQFGCSRSYSL